MMKPLITLGAWLLIVAAATVRADEPPGYADQVGDKLLRGATNIGYGWMEIPKNMVNEVNQHGALYAPLGLGKGLAYMGGRLAAGIADLVSFPVPTKPLTQPPRVWDLTDQETRFLPQDKPQTAEPASPSR